MVPVVPMKLFSTQH